MITGGATGIGTSLVAHFVEQGAKVAFLDIDTDAGKALAQRLRVQMGNAPLFVACNLCDIGAQEAAIEAGRCPSG